MENGSTASHEGGFKTMSQHADMAGGDDSDLAGGAASAIASGLKSHGIDPDRITEAAGERASQLQELVMDEIRARPMRALGWAAAAGLIVGFWASR